MTLRENGYLPEDHADGCVLTEKRELVEALLRQGGKDEQVKTVC